jgi:hypothetical protein
VKNVNTTDAFINVTDDQFEAALKQKALTKKKPSTVGLATDPADVVFSFEGTKEEFGAQFPEKETPPPLEKVKAFQQSVPSKIQKAKEMSGLKVEYFYQLTHDGEIVEEGELLKAKDRWELLELKDLK